MYFSQYSSSRIYCAFITEKEKNLLPDIIDNLEFINKGSSSSIKEITNENSNDYFIFKKSNTNRDDKNIICIFNIYHKIGSDLNLEIEKGKKVGIYKESSSSSYYKKKYFVLS